MKNTTNCTYDLMLKVNLFITRKQRRFNLIYFLITAVLGVGLILADLLSEQAVTADAGIFFLIFSVVAAIALLKQRKSKWGQAVQKSIDDNPNKKQEYQFEDNAITVIQESDKVQSTTKIDYSYIASVVMVDSNTCYFLTKGNIYYILYDEQGINDIYDYLCAKKV